MLINQEKISHPTRICQQASCVVTLLQSTLTRSSGIATKRRYLYLAHVISWGMAVRVLSRTVRHLSHNALGRINMLVRRISAVNAASWKTIRNITP